MAEGGAGDEREPGDAGDAELMTGEAVALDVRPTGFVLSAAGLAIDVVVSVVIVLGALIPLASTGVLADPALGPALSITVLVFAFLVVPLAVEQATRGRSLGRLAVGARIVRDDGGAVRFRHSFIRALVGVVEVYSTFGGVAVLVGLLNGRSKRVGDLLAGTYSQLERVPKAIPAAYAVPWELAGWAATADVATLPDRLSRRIAQYLSQAEALRPAARVTLAEGLAREAAHYVSPVPAVPAEPFLVAVACLRRDRDLRALVLQRERLEALDPVLRGLPHGFPDRS